MGLTNTLGVFRARRSLRSGNPLLDAFLPMLLPGGAIGGLGALLGKFNDAGLGCKAHSWVGSGENKPLAPEEVELALGPAHISEIAGRADISVDDTKRGLSRIIPGLVDNVSVGGSLPTGNLAQSMKDFDFAPILAG